VKKIALIVFLILFVAGLILGAWVYRSLYEPNVSEEGAGFLFISTGADFKEVRMAIAPMLIHPESFFRVAQLRKYPNSVKPGRYEIPAGIHNMDLVALLRSGNQKPLMVTFNNVKSIAEVCGLVAEQLECDSLSCFEAFTARDFLEENNLNPETAKSLLIPNTYEFFWNTSATGFRNRMVTEYQRFWDDNRIKQAQAIRLTPLEVSILASIVVKESAKKDEMARIAGLYLNRLKKQMKLQSDPTVIYGIQHALGKDTLIRRVLYKDLVFESPYNTYLNSGLPPAPIAIPEGFAIDAVLQAEAHQYIYMCADPDRPGYHSFAKNDQQHAVNKRKYVQWLQKQGIYR
jgi:UPF0755 protein